MAMKRYNPSEIEPKWQQIWANDNRYHANDGPDNQKFYISCMFPYPSGVGMHVGHAFEHVIVDAVARFERAHGKNVMNPMGWDAFGLPAENFAIKTGTPPQVTTRQNIANFTHQLKTLGLSIDWSREINTSSPEYYKWTQWVFTQLFERGLAYQKEANQWWCPVDMTVLANEQVEGGKCWRCGSEVEKKSMNQWFFKITDYADALLEEIPALDWPDKIKHAQTNWIGKSEGAEIDFSVEGGDEQLTVFTTRPDTIFGATFLVVAPEHPVLKSVVTDAQRDAVDEYVTKALKRSEIDRMAEGKEKTGVDTGARVINPATGEQIPVWVADYVLWGYGTGAIMAVPAHDERDFEFARAFNLPVIDVVAQDFNETLENVKDVEGSVVIGYDPKADKYLTLRHDDKSRLVSGGRDGDEDFETSARRELKEEAGFSDVIDFIQLGTPMYSYYYNPIKDSNRRSLGYNYLAVLDPAAQGEAELEAHEEQFETVWRDFDTLMAEVKAYGDTVEHWVEALNRARDAAVAYNAGEAYHQPCYHGEGILINSGEFNGRATSDAREQIVAWLEQQGMGRAKTTYKMRDWLVSRQRYWGAPIPIVHCETDGAVAVPEKDLPVVLPDVEDFAPKGQSVLAGEEDWVNTTCPKCGGPAKRETDTMDGYACSSWYLLRYTDPHNSEQAWAPEKAKYWTPVDMYVGGDHAVAHLLYVRFWNHVFFDMGLVPSKEPVKKLVYHGLIGAEDGRKMSKSLGNVVDPLEVIDQGYGADALRTFELFLGPINENSQWSSRGIAGVYRFLNRAWTLTQEYIDAGELPTGENADLTALHHRTVKKVTTDIHRLSFNTGIAALMEYVNELYKLKTDGFTTAWQEPIESLVQLLGVFAPHMSADLWQQLGKGDMLDTAPWPTWDEALTVADTITIIVQVNGKLRAKLNVAADTDEETIRSQALADENVQRFVEGEPKKVIYIKGKLINIVC